MQVWFLVAHLADVPPVAAARNAITEREGVQRDHPASAARPAPDEGRATISKSSG
jgi:hypothetical protein